MWHLEELSWSLPELSDLYLKSNSLDRVLKLLEVDAAFIGQRMKEVKVVDGPLLRPKDQVNPEMKVVRDIITF